MSTEGLFPNKFRHLSSVRLDSPPNGLNARKVNISGHQQVESDGANGALDAGSAARRTTWSALSASRPPRRAKGLVIRLLGSRGASAVTGLLMLALGSSEAAAQA